MRLRHVKQMVNTTLFTVGSFALFMSPIFAALWWSFPRVDVAAWKKGPPPLDWAHRHERTRMAEATNTPQHVRFHYVPLGAMSTDLKLAVLVGEDASFFSHGPVDYDAIQEALEQWWAGRRLRGASTISQQLAKNLFLNSTRSLWRKIEEARLASFLERKLTKHRVFELYLNIVELGPGIYGVDAASRYYFDVTAAEINAEQASALAATIPGPLRSSPRSRTRAWSYRQSVIDTKMRSLSHLRTVVEQQSRPDLIVED